ncbi:hypothetical protein M885DRAFT_437477, partial [Pelagophyceae sp. CCMP2097]
VGTAGAMLLAGKTAVLTGAGRGIGAAAAKLFARHGCNVVVNDLDVSVAQGVVSEIKAAGGEAIAVGGSVVDPHFPAILMAKSMLVNNAGFLWDGMLHKMTDAQFDAVVECHGAAPFRMIRAAAPYFRDAGKSEIARGLAPRDRCIVNVSSTSGLHGNVGQANYSFAKAGVVGLTKTVAKEWGAMGVRCNAVAFGMIDTRMTRGFSESDAPVDVDGSAVVQGLPDHVADMWNKPELLRTIPLGRKGDAEEAAGGIFMLCSPWATYVTGHVLEVTGGAGM